MVSQSQIWIYISFRDEKRPVPVRVARVSPTKSFYRKPYAVKGLRRFRRRKKMPFSYLA